MEKELENQPLIGPMGIAYARSNPSEEEATPYGAELCATQKLALVYSVSRLHEPKGSYAKYKINLPFFVGWVDRSEPKASEAKPTISEREVGFRYAPTHPTVRNVHEITSTTFYQDSDNKGIANYE